LAHSIAINASQCGIKIIHFTSRIYAHYVPCEVMGVKTVTKIVFNFIVGKKFASWDKKTVLYLLFSTSFVECLSFALTHAVRWWRHCWTTRALSHGLASPTRKTIAN